LTVFAKQDYRVERKDIDSRSLALVLRRRYKEA